MEAPPQRAHGSIRGKRRRSHDTSAPVLPSAAPVESAEHVLVRDAADDAATPLRAHAHVAPLLTALATSTGVPPSTLRILDPFYCDGAAERQLRSLGFAAAVNPAGRDFWAEEAHYRSSDDYHVLVTNPPFSGDHIPRLLDFVLAAGRPAALLLPLWVLKKRYYHEWRRRCRDSHALAFVTPNGDGYEFAAPASSRPATVDAEAGTVAVRIGYFDCVWFVVGNAWLPALAAVGGEHMLPLCDGDATLVREAGIAELHAIAAGRTHKVTPAERRWRKKQRRAAGGDPSS